MPCYIVGGDSYDRKLIEYPDELFDAMVEELHNPTPVIPRGSRWGTDGSYDNRPSDPDYFKKYYKKNLCSQYECPKCGRQLSSKSNLSKHQKTIRCQRLTTKEI